MKKILQGITASKGIVEGEVQLIESEADITDFKEGAILVTNSTNPSYVSAMAKAKGIITDIGGITYHAAIIARELGIPCIVGTNSATKTLSTGQIIILNADEGVIYEK